MRKFVLALAALAAVGIALPVTSSARAEDRVVIKSHREHHDFYRHRDYDRHHGHKTVIIKHGHGDHGDRD